MRYNLAFKSKTNSGSKGYTTFFSSILDPFSDVELGAFLTGLDVTYLANNAHVQTSAVLDDVYDDEIELPDPADLVDEKDVVFYLGSTEDPDVLFVMTFGHIKFNANLQSAMRVLVEGRNPVSGDSISPFETKDGVQLDRIIKVVERTYRVIGRND